MVQPTPRKAVAQQCTRMGNYNLSHQGTFQGRPICLARDDNSKTYTCKRRSGAEMNHIRRVMIHLETSPHILPTLNVVNTGSVLTDTYTFQDEIKGSLSDMVARRGPMSEMEAAKLFKQVLECLACCHAKGIIIKDMELDHFVITATDSDKVYLHDVVDCDFYHPDADHDAPINPFIAPEVMMSSQHTAVSNVWSAGVMLYVLLSQHWPFFGNTKEELIQSIFAGHFFVHPSWSYELRHLFHCMLTVQPRRRLFASQLLCHPWFRICDTVERSCTKHPQTRPAESEEQTVTPEDDK